MKANRQEDFPLSNESLVPPPLAVLDALIRPYLALVPRASVLPAPPKEDDGDGVELDLVDTTDPFPIIVGYVDEKKDEWTEERYPSPRLAKARARVLAREGTHCWVYAEIASTEERP